MGRSREKLLMGRGRTTKHKCSGVTCCSGAKKKQRIQVGQSREKLLTCFWCSLVLVSLPNLPQPNPPLELQVPGVPLTRHQNEPKEQRRRDSEEPPSKELLSGSPFCPLPPEVLLSNCQKPWAWPSSRLRHVAVHLRVLDDGFSVCPHRRPFVKACQVRDLDDMDLVFFGPRKEASRILFNWSGF